MFVNNTHLMTHAEIAHALGLSRKQVMTAEQNALAKLKKILLKLGINREDIC